MHANITSLTFDLRVLVYPLEIKRKKKKKKYATGVKYVTFLLTFKKIDEYYNYDHIKQK
jgi:hypothetical protein